MKILQTCILLTAIHLPFVAVGEDGIDEDAQAAFDDGKQKFADKDYLGSAESFRKAYELKPTWKLLYNIGQSEAAAKRYGLALEAFELYLAEGGDEIAADRQKNLREEIKRLRDMVGYVAISASEGAVIRVDGVKRGVAPLIGELVVAASVSHDVVAEVNGEVVAKEQFRVHGGKTVSVELKGGVSAAQGLKSGDPQDEEGAGEESKEDKSDGSPLKAIGWSSTVGGVLVLGAGITVGLIGISQNRDLVADCEDGCPPDYEEEEKKHEKLANVGTVLIAVGGVLAATGVVLLIVDKKKGKERNVAFVPAVNGFVIEGRF